MFEYYVSVILRPSKITRHVISNISEKLFFPVSFDLAKFSKKKTFYKNQNDKDTSVCKCRPLSKVLIL